ARFLCVVLVPLDNPYIAPVLCGRAARPPRAAPDPREHRHPRCDRRRGFLSTSGVERDTTSSLCGLLDDTDGIRLPLVLGLRDHLRSEERRVGTACGCV